MKRMELKITLTFAIMFVVGVVISGIYSVVSNQSGFFTVEVMADGLFIWVMSGLTQDGISC